MAIVVRGERIEAVVPAAQLKVPAGAEVVDVKDQYALPGFINSHEHLATPPNRKFAEAMMRRDLFSGVTAARCMGDDLRALADLARASRVLEIAGPDLYYAALFAGRDFMSDPRIDWRPAVRALKSERLRGYMRSTEKRIWPTQ